MVQSWADIASSLNTKAGEMKSMNEITSKASQVDTQDMLQDMPPDGKSLLDFVRDVKGYGEVKGLLIGEMTGWLRSWASYDMGGMTQEELVQKYIDMGVLVKTGTKFGHDLYMIADSQSTDNSCI